MAAGCSDDGGATLEGGQFRAVFLEGGFTSTGAENGSLMVGFDNRICSDWAGITECLDGFPPPEVAIDSAGEIATKAWVFRGHKSSSYKLQPRIERVAQSKSMQWAALEALVSSEFRARARIHLTAPLIPDDELSWLAMMQHYAVPTRLLDFTYSPFVGLYFAMRSGHYDTSRTHVRLWAVDARAVNDRFLQVALKASARGHASIRLRVRRAVLNDPDYLATDRDNMTSGTEGLHWLIAESLSATGKRRGALNRNGCVCAASPPAFNSRLVSQHGVFLINCAEGLSFWDSLTKLMEGCSGWGRSVDIPVGLIPEIESRLLQMNIHEQSLFPDMEGLAGLIRQKIRLQWK
jgi:FRG domain